MDPELLKLLATMFGGQKSQGNSMAGFGDIIKQLNAPTPTRHLGMGGGEMGPGNPTGAIGGSPFENGFFKTGAERQQVEQSRGSMGWAQPPQAQNPMSFGSPQAPMAPFMMPPVVPNMQNDPNAFQQNLDQNMAMFQPGFWSAQQAKRKAPGTY